MRRCSASCRCANTRDCRGVKFNNGYASYLEVLYAENDCSPRSWRPFVRTPDVYAARQRVQGDGRRMGRSRRSGDGGGPRSADRRTRPLATDVLVLRICAIGPAELLARADQTALERRLGKPFPARS